MTFGIVLLSWVFFRAQTLDSALLAITKVFSFDFSFPFIGATSSLINSIFVLTVGLLFDLFLFRTKIHLEHFGRKFTPFKIAVIVTVIILMLSLFYSSSNNFIYFQF